MFSKTTIWAYPTDTSFGLGVRADDERGLEKLAKLKGRSAKKFFSLMVKDFKMLKEFAVVPKGLNESFFLDSPKTAIFKPKSTLPKSPYWPNDKVAFRISTIPEISEKIEFPITATSANLGGGKPIFDVERLKRTFRSRVRIVPNFTVLPEAEPSEIWDFTVIPSVQIR
jgi:L-threonylcarbamoyladenylate synthase